MRSNIGLLLKHLSSRSTTTSALLFPLQKAYSTSTNPPYFFWATVCINSGSFCPFLKFALCRLLWSLLIDFISLIRSLMLTKLVRDAFSFAPAAHSRKNDRFQQIALRRKLQTTTKTNKKGLHTGPFTFFS